MKFTKLFVLVSVSVLVGCTVKPAPVVETATPAPCVARLIAEKPGGRVAYYSKPNQAMSSGSLVDGTQLSCYPSRTNGWIEVRVGRGDDPYWVRASRVSLVYPYNGLAK